MITKYIIVQYCYIIVKKVITKYITVFIIQSTVKTAQQQQQCPKGHKTTQLKLF